MRMVMASLAAGLVAMGALAPALAEPPYERAERHGRGGHARDWRGPDRQLERDYDRSDQRIAGWGREGRYDRRHSPPHDGWSYDRGWSGGQWFAYGSVYGSPYDWRRVADGYGRPRHSGRVVITDYRRYHLPPPRHGQVYYRDERTGEILLIAAATGLVLWALSQ